MEREYYNEYETMEILPEEDGLDEEEEIKEEEKDE